MSGLAMSMSTKRSKESRKAVSIFIPKVVPFSKEQSFFKAPPSIERRRRRKKQQYRQRFLST